MSQTKTSIEKLQESFEKFAAEQFNTIGEPSVLMLVVDWKVGRNDFPAGIIMFRDQNPAISDTLSILEQLNKMSSKIAAIYTKAIQETRVFDARLNDTIKAKQDLLVKLQEEVKTLEQRKSA